LNRQLLENQDYFKQTKPAKLSGMKYGRNFGLLLLVGAFVFAAAGNAARGVSGESGFLGIVGAATVLEILTPELFSTTSDFINNHLHPFIWDPLLLGILAFPGWLILGLPGAVLLWKYRKIPIGGEATNEELAYNTYEDVLAAAEEADFENPLEPSRYNDLQEYDPLYPPDDGVKFDHLPQLPMEASDTADFSNEVSIMPDDFENYSEENERVNETQNLNPLPSQSEHKPENESDAKGNDHPAKKYPNPII